jgi:hypothetical protein
MVVLQCLGMGNNDWKPWTDYPEVKEEYLSIVANIIRQARKETLKLYDPVRGDNSWSHGVRAFVWSKFGLIEGSKAYPWLSLLDEVPRLRATFAICGRPFRFYRGIPEEPPSNYLSTTFAEIRQLQWVLKLDGDGLRPIDRILRIAVETDEQGETTDITLVEVDEVGNVTNSYAIPPAVAKSNVIPAHAPAIDVQPPVVDPKKTEDQKAQEKAKKKKNE